MTVTGLTGLEFQWFGQGQFLATRYEHGEAMDLDIATAELGEAVGLEAAVGLAGPAALRRVSACFLLDAEAVTRPETDPAPFALGLVGAVRRSRALHRLAASFEHVAARMEASDPPAETGP